MGHRLSRSIPSSVEKDSDLVSAIRMISTKSPIAELHQKIGDIHIPDQAKDQIKKLLSSDLRPPKSDTTRGLFGSKDSREDSTAMEDDVVLDGRPNSSGNRHRGISFANLSQDQEIRYTRPTSVSSGGGYEGSRAAKELATIQKLNELHDSQQSDDDLSVMFPGSDPFRDMSRISELHNESILDISHVPAAWAPSSLSFSIPERSDTRRSNTSRLRERRIRLANLKEQLNDEELIQQEHIRYLSELEAIREQHKYDIRKRNEQKYLDGLEDARKKAEAEKLEKRKLRVSQKEAQKEVMLLHNLEQRKSEIERKKILLTESKRRAEDAMEQHSRSQLYEHRTKEKLKKMEEFDSKQTGVEKRLQQLKYMKDQEVRIKKLQDAIKHEEAAIRKQEYENQTRAKPEWVNRFRKVGENVSNIQQDYNQRMDNSKVYHHSRKIDNDTMFQYQDADRRAKQEVKELDAVRKIEASKVRIQLDAKHISRDNIERSIQNKERKAAQEQTHVSNLQDFAAEISQKQKRIEVIQNEKKEHERIMRQIRKAEIEQELSLRESTYQHIVRKEFLKAADEIPT